MLHSVSARPAVVVGGVATVVALGGLFLGTRSAVNGQDSSSSEVRVGTYKPREVFKETRRKAMQKSLETLREKYQQAAESGDQKKLQALQKKMQKVREKTIQDFLAEVKTAVPRVAQAEGVPVVAVRVVYSEASVQTKDLTSALVKELNSEADSTTETESSEDSGSDISPSSTN